MTTDPQTNAISGLIERDRPRFDAIYQGLVTDNGDPDKHGRLKMRVPSVHQDTEIGWVPGLWPLGGNGAQMAMLIPDKNSHVMVQFVDGDPRKPIWVGCYYPDDAPG